MPPLPLWVRGPVEVERFMLGHGSACEGSRLIPTSANGAPAAAIYHQTPEGHFDPWAIVVLETSDGRIAGLHHFLWPELFEQVGLPARLDA